jgi:hypothetical protein
MKLALLVATTCIALVTVQCEISKNNNNGTPRNQGGPGARHRSEWDCDAPTDYHTEMPADTTDSDLDCTEESTTPNPSTGGNYGGPVVTIIPSPPPPPPLNEYNTPPEHDEECYEEEICEDDKDDTNEECGEDEEMFEEEVCF